MRKFVPFYKCSTTAGSSTHPCTRTSGKVKLQISTLGKEMVQSTSDGASLPFSEARQNYASGCGKEMGKVTQVFAVGSAECESCAVMQDDVKVAVK